MYISSANPRAWRATLPRNDAQPIPAVSSYYDFVMAAYVCVLLCSNLIGPAKETSIRSCRWSAASLPRRCAVLPALLHLRRHPDRGVWLGARSPRRVWAGFGALAFASLMAAIVVSPAALGRVARPPGRSVEAIFGNTPRIVVGLDHRLSVRHVRQQLRAGQDEDLDRRAAGCGPASWARPCAANSSTRCSSISSPSTAACRISPDRIMFTQYVLKSGWEIVAAPLTYRVVAFLESADKRTTTTWDTNFTPFSLKA